MKPVQAPEEEAYDPPPSAKIFCGLIYVPELDLAGVLRDLEQAWGPVEFISQRYPFDYTRYYDEEMGSPLSRKYVTFRDEVGQEVLPRLKWEGKRVEGRYLHPTGGRRINIDPGLLLPDRLVLATTKPCAHRPYLGRGIYADLTLIYQKRSFQPLAWTYPDYGAPETVAMMNRLREHVLLQKRAIREARIE
jgi:hypothetical protein